MLLFAFTYMYQSAWHVQKNLSKNQPSHYFSLKTPDLLGVDGRIAGCVMIYRSWLEKADSANEKLVGFFG